MTKLYEITKIILLIKAKEFSSFFRRYIMFDLNGNFYKPERGSSAVPDHIMLSFCGDPKTEIAVSWRTSTDVENGYILYRKDGNSDWLKAESAFKTAQTDIDISNYHSVRLCGLEPGTKYFYTVGSDENRSEVFSFETEAENTEKFSFLVIADHQKGSPCHLPDYTVVGDMLRKALKEHPECRFILTAGDNCDNGQNELQWNGMFEGLRGIIESIPYMMTTGNHDNRGFITYFPEPTGKFYLEHADFFDFQFRDAYPQNGPDGYETENYSFDYGNAHFLIMGINAPEKVADWAYEDLQSSSKKWKLGTYHFPIYPVMPEGQNNDGYPWLRKPIEEGRLDILFAGHEHSFARTFPTKGDELFDRPSQGTIHYIAGNGGGNIYHSNCQKVWHSCFFPQEEHLGFYTVVEIDGGRLTATAYLTDGRIVDLFSVDKERDTVYPPALAPVYDRTKMAFKGRMLELSARGLFPEKKDGIWFAPFGVLIQAIGGKVIKEKDSVSAEAYGHRAVFTVGSRFAKTDLGTVEMSAEPYFLDGQLFIPVDESTKMFEMEWYYAERNNFINWNTPSEDRPLCKHPE